MRYQVIPTYISVKTGKHCKTVQGYILTNDEGFTLMESGNTPRVFRTQQLAVNEAAEIEELAYQRYKAERAAANALASPEPESESAPVWEYGEPNPDCSYCMIRKTICYSCEEAQRESRQSADYKARGIVRNLADYETAMSLWDGGYEKYFLSCDESGDIDGSAMCPGCVKKELETRAEYGEGSSVTMDDFGYRLEVSDSDTGLHGGVICDQCYAYAVEPTCAECGDDLYGDKDARILFHTSGEMALHLHCAMPLIANGVARRVPGSGIDISYARQREVIASPGAYTYKG